MRSSTRLKTRRASQCSLVSGALFTLVGAALREETSGDAAAAGSLTLANTLGAALGAALAGLLLLPWLGVEAALFTLAVVYGVVALALLPWAAPLPRLARIGGAGLFALVVVLFPFGLMNNRFLRKLIEARAGGGVRMMALHESQTKTAILLQTE